MSTPTAGTVVVGGVEASVYCGGDGESGVIESVPEGDTPRATAIFEVPWESRYNFLKGLAGSSSSGSGGSGVVRTPPFAYPPSPNLYCIAVPSIQPVGHKWDAGLNWYTAREARITAVFGVPKYGFETGTLLDPSGRPWWTTRGRLSAEVFTPPDGAFFYTSGADSGKVVEGSVAGIIRPRVEFSISSHMMPYIPLFEAMECDGTVNATPVTIGNRTFPEGCLLFAGMDWVESSDVLGNRTYEVTYTILGNHSITWNQVMDSAGQWITINTASDETGDYPYTPFDFWSILP